MTPKQLGNLLFARSAEHGWAGDLRLVQLQDRQHRSVSLWVQEPDPFPRCLQGPSLGLAIPDYTGNKQVWVVECGAESVSQRVTKLAAFVDRPRRVDADVAGYAAGGRELADQPPQSGFVERYVRIDLRVGAFEIDACDDRGSAVARTRHIKNILTRRRDQPVEMRVDQVEGWRGSPMSEQPWLDVLGAQRLAQQWVLPQVDLCDRQVVRGLPPGDQRPKLLG